MPSQASSPITWTAGRATPLLKWASRMPALNTTGGGAGGPCRPVRKGTSERHPMAGSTGGEHERHGPMKLTIVAATGGIGRELLDQAIAAGHDVTAVVRNPAALPDGPARTVRADLSAADPAALQSAVAGADAVLSGLGARPRADAGIAERGTRAIVEAMTAAGARRLIVVSAAPVGTVASPARPRPPRSDPGDGIVMRTLLTPLVKRLFRDRYADLARMEDVILASRLDWTIVRPPRLTDGPASGRYRTAFGRNVRGGLRIARADVASFMLAAVGEPDTIGQIVGLAG
jgi:putative NADH-flavin reductase